MKIGFVCQVVSIKAEVAWPEVLNSLSVDIMHGCTFFPRLSTKTEITFI